VSSSSSSDPSSAFWAVHRVGVCGRGANSLFSTKPVGWLVLGRHTDDARARATIDESRDGWFSSSRRRRRALDDGV
jgi:hypothetical protein